MVSGALIYLVPPLTSTDTASLLSAGALAEVGSHGQFVECVFVQDDDDAVLRVGLLARETRSSFKTQHPVLLSCVPHSRWPSTPVQGSGLEQANVADQLPTALSHDPPPSARNCSRIRALTARETFHAASSARRPSRCEALSPASPSESAASERYVWYTSAGAPRQLPYTIWGRETRGETHRVVRRARARCRRRAGAGTRGATLGRARGRRLGRA